MTITTTAGLVQSWEAEAAFCVSHADEGTQGHEAFSQAKQETRLEVGQIIAYMECRHIGPIHSYFKRGC